MRTQTQYRKEQERLAKVETRRTKTLKDEADAYKKLSKETRAQKNESKRLAIELIKLAESGKRNTKEYREMAVAYRRVTAEANKGDRVLKRVDKTVGDNFRNVGNYRSALTKLSGALGQLGVAFGAGAILRNAAGTIAEFEQSIADLQAITGAAGEDLQFFKDQAVELGKTTKGGAAAVVEAYKLIGSAKPELLKNAQALDSVTQSAITLSKASGLDLPDAATRLTDAMNQFGASASEAERFINVLAAGSKEGAAEIPQVTDAMVKFGAAARTSNVSVEESTALIETLAENGLKGAEAGTAIRNVMLKMSAPDALPKEAVAMMKQLGISFEDINDPSKSFAERLEAMKPLLADGAALQKVFGKENAIAAINILENTDRIKELTVAVEGTNTANEQAETRSKTLGEAFANIGRAWDSFVLSLVSGEDSMKGIIKWLDWLAKNLPAIIKWVGKLASVFAGLKLTLAAINTANHIKKFGLLGSAIKDVGKSADKAKTGVKAFGGALGGIALSAVLTILVDMAQTFIDIASGAERARYEINLFNEITAKGAELAQNLIRKNTEALQQQINTINLSKKSQVEKDRLIAKAFEDAEARTDRQITKAREFKDALTQERKAAEARVKELKKNFDGMVALSTATNEQIIEFENAKNAAARLRSEEAAMFRTVVALKDSRKELRQSIVDQTVATQESTKASDENVKGLQREQEAVEELTDSWEEYLKWREEVRAIEEQALREEGRMRRFLAGDLSDFDENPLEGMVAIDPEEIDFQTFEDIIDEFQDFQEAITQILLEQIDKRIDLLKKEEDAAKGQQSFLENLAAQGNIIAQQSIAEQIEIQREAQAEQARLERQKQNIQLISQGLSTFNAELEAGKNPAQALAATILSTNALVGFLKGIQFFAKGTNFAPEGLAVVDEEGAEIITDSKGRIKQIGTDGGARLTHLNRGDRVHTAQETSDILSQFDNANNASLMNRANGHAGNSYDIMLLNRSMQDVKQAVENQPTDNMDWEGLSKVIPEFSRTRRQGGDVVKDRYMTRRW